MAHGGQPTFHLSPPRLQVPSQPARGSPPPSQGSSDPLISTRDLIAGIRANGIFVDGATEGYLQDLRVTAAQANRALDSFRHYEEAAARVAVETRTASIPGEKERGKLSTVLTEEYLFSRFRELLMD
jgi:hypothetical protein